jgi:hypothetical protein
MNTPKVTPRSKGTVPVGYAYGPNLEERGVMWVPWDKGSVLNREGEGLFVNPDGIHAEAEQVEIPQEVIESKRASLPPIRRRTARQRAQELATQLFRDGLKTQEVYGRPIWPASVARIVEDLGCQDKDIYAQVDALVTHFMTITENQTKERDSKLSTIGWHGHYD